MSATSLFLGLLLGLPLSFTAATVFAATADSCDGSSTQNNIKITAVHGKVFYIDSGQNQAIDAAYVGYKVTTTAIKSNVWVRLDSFSGGVVSLSNPLDADMPIGNMANSDNQMAYFLLKANKSTNLAQTHVVRVFIGRPDLPGSTEAYNCTFKFVKVSETIKAAANKVNSITPSTTTLVLGSTMTVDVRGYTGVIGQGSPLDGAIMWLSPAARSTWPSSALRLESVTLDFYNNKQYKSAVNNGSFSDQLYVKTLSNGSTIQGNKYYYKAVYTYRILGKTGAATTVSPVAQISSGTQIKHTDMAATPSVNLNTNTTTIDASLTKTASSTASYASNKMTITYTITLRNRAQSAVVFDQVIDQADPNLTFTGTPTIGGVNTTAPTQDISGNWVFTTPISLTAAAVNGETTVNLVYQMIQRNTCTSGEPFTFSNSATAKIGLITLGATTNSISGVHTSGNCATTTIVVTPTSDPLPVEVLTEPATSVAATSASLNGMIDPNGAAGLAAVFELATNASLTSASSISLSNTTSSVNSYAVSAASGTLTAATTYYFRVKVGSGTSAVYGAILSFTTPEAAANPVAVTTNATNISGSTTYSVDLNGTIDPNFIVGGAGARFDYGTNADANCPVGGPGTVLSVTATADGATLNLTSSSPTDVLQAISGLSANTFYCYRIVATYSTNQTAAGSWVAFRTSTMTAQTITYVVPTFPGPNTTQMSISSTQSSTASTTSSLAITYTSNSPDVCTVNASTGLIASTSFGGTCSITATQGGNTSYYPAVPVTISFQIIPQVILSYNSNGSTSGTVPTSQSVTAGGSLTVSTNSGTLAKTNFSFTGWNTSSLGIGTDYAASSSITLNSNITLYAKWTATITYDGNTNTSGSVPSLQTAIAGPISLRLNTGTLAKSLYILVGWNTSADGTGNPYALGETYDLVGNVTLFAQWVENGKWLITYYGLGTTSGVPASAAVTQTASYTVSASTPVRSGWTFIGWNTKSDYTGTSYNSSATFTPIANTNLYARWQASVVYNINSGTGTTPTTQTQLDGANFSTPGTSGFSKTYYNFAGWNTAADGAGDTFLGSTSYKFSVPMTLYAQWNPILLTIIFDSNLSGGDNASYTKTLPSNTSTALPTNEFTPAGKVFKGWGTSNGASTVVYTNQQVVTFTSTQTLWAVWLTEFTITYAVNDAGYGYINGENPQVLGSSQTGTQVEALPYDGYYFSSWNAGSAVNTATRTDTASSTVTYTATFTAKSNPYLAWSNPTAINYGTTLSGTQLNAVVKTSSTGSILISTCTYSPASGSVLAAGNQILSVTCVPDNNQYNSVSGTVTLVVNRLPITVTAEAKSKDYNASEPAFTYTSSPSLIGADAFSGSLTRTSGENVGSYAINQGSVALSANYIITYISANLTINTRAITVTAAAKTKVYGAADPQLTSSVTSGTVKVGDNFSGSLTRATGESVGNQAISQGTLTLGSNYAITFVSANLVIGTKPITVAADNLTKNTSDADPTFTYTITSGGPLIVGDSFSGILARANAGTNTAGNYAITQGALALSANYNITFTPGTLTISSKIVPYVNWSNPANIVYGTTLSGTQLNAVFQVSNGGSTVPGTCTYSPAAATLLDAGTITLSVTCVPTDGVTYETVTKTVSIVVTPKPLTVPVTASNKPYDTNSSATVTPGSLSGKVGSDDVTFTSGKITAVFADATSANGKIVTLTVAADPLGGTKAANYTLTTPTNPTANITKVTVNVTAQGQSVVAGSNLTTLTYAVASLVGADTGDPFTGITCSTNYVTTDSAGTSRTITCSGGTATNYVPSHISGSVTITSAPVTSYTVTYVNSAGTGSVPTETDKVSGATFGVGSGSSLNNPGYNFTGWSDGTNTYQATNTYTMPAANVTFTAQWAVPFSYTITYSTSGSQSGYAPAPTIGSGSVTLRTNTGSLAKNGYVLNSWNSLANCGGIAHSVGGSFNLTSSLTLYPCFVVYVEPTPDPEPRNNVAAKVKPVVVWKNPNAIKTTTTLSTTQLNAVATTSIAATTVIVNPATPDKLPTSAPTIAGTYIYTPIVPTVVTAGVTQVTTVTSAANALTGTTKTVSTTTAPSSTTTTTSSTNTEEKPVLGQGTTLAPGLQKMKVVFIPTDSTSYEPVESIVEILVQAETKVNWIDPTPIKKTTPVGPAQLNAVGVAPGLSNNVPGNYKYDVPEGTTLAPGKYPVKVTFTPTDPNYLPSEGAVTITVTADINPLATPIVTPSNVAAVKPITNTTSLATATIVKIGNGLSSAATSGTQVSVLPNLNFSGKTTVTVKVSDEGEIKEVTVPVTVLPLAAVTPLVTPDNKGQSTIAWKASPNAISYEVTLAGKSVCTTNTTSCSTPALIGPISNVQVSAMGNDETLSPLSTAAYKAPNKPITALVVYFDTNKFNLDAKDKAEIRAIAKTIIAQGFKNIVINGHTDKMTGVDNKVLSNNRANATYEYLKELATGLNVTLGAFASTKPAVVGNSAAALAANRRAEVGVY